MCRRRPVVIQLDITQSPEMSHMQHTCVLLPVSPDSLSKSSSYGEVTEEATHQLTVNCFYEWSHAVGLRAAGTGTPPPTSRNGTKGLQSRHRTMYAFESIESLASSLLTHFRTSLFSGVLV